MTPARFRNFRRSDSGYGSMDHHTSTPQRSPPCDMNAHYDFPPPQPSEHRRRVSSASLQRGAGTELVVEMQDLLNVPHALAVLGRCLPGAPPQISCQRCTRCLQRAGSKELPPGAGTCVKRHAGGGLGAEITPHEPAINPHHERELVTCPHLP